MSKTADHIISPDRMSSAEGSPVSHTHSRGNAKGRKIIVTCGRTLRGLFENFNPDGLCSKTSRRLKPATEDGTSGRCSLSWPRAGMTRNGIVYQLQPSAPITRGTGFGLWPTPKASAAGPELAWPTPRAQDSKHGTATAWEMESSRSELLHVAVSRRERMWATPSSRDWKDTPGMATQAGSRSRLDQLARQVYQAERVPTPRAEDAESCGNHPGKVDSLTGFVKQFPTPTSSRRSGLQSHGQNVITGQLNPTWVEWLMGFPLRWTALEPSETPLSRKSRKSSRSASSKSS